MATSKIYYEAHKEEILAYQKDYRARNPEKWHGKNKLWRETNPEKMKAYMRIYNISPRGRFTKLKLRARRSSISLTIKMDDFLRWYKEQNPNCYYCGAELYMEGGQKKLDGYSVDRKDNNTGYTLGNIVLCCNRCNMAKGSWFTEEQMLEIAHKYFQLENPIYKVLKENTCKHIVTKEGRDYCKSAPNTPGWMHVCLLVSGAECLEWTNIQEEWRGEETNATTRRD